MKKPDSGPLPTRSGRREHLLSVALDLFYAQGFHGTGIDSILARSGVAKMTLYKYFPSKEDLILGVLARRDAEFITWLKGSLDLISGNPQDKVSGLFDAYESWFRSPQFHGCLFLNACAEYPDATHPIHQAAASHKRRLYELVLALIGEGGAPHPVLLAQEIMVLLEGATAIAHVSSAPVAARRAKRAAQILMCDALGA